MRAAICDPYLDSLGGGERYSMAVASVLAKNGFIVDVEWKDTDIKKKLEERFGITLKDVNFMQTVKRGSFYDLVFWVSDGSVPTLLGRKNLLHFQVPFQAVSGRSLLNKMKLFRISKIVCNSYFTKSFIDREYGVDSIVIYPPVAVEKMKPKRKEDLIIYVGRFSQLGQSKRQDILVNAFKKFFDRGYDTFKLVLIGGSDVGNTDFINELRMKAKDYPIEIFENLNFKQVLDLYAKAKIFWSAAGYDIKEDRFPQKMEHFGITLVEAMASGAVAIAYSGGGHKEVIKDGVNGFLWSTINELIQKTENVVGDPKFLRSISSAARSDSGKYSYGEFERKLLSII